MPTLDQTVARNFTHVNKWREHGHDTIVAGFSRGASAGHGRAVDIILGEHGHGKLFSRIKMYKDSLTTLMSLLPRTQFVFVYTLDNFLIAWMAKVAARSDVKIVLFLMDIRDGFVGIDLFSKIVQQYLIFAFDQCEVIAVSSRHFIEDFSRKYLNREPGKWIEIENKINPREIGELSAQPPAAREGLVIGYIGALRCQRSLEVLYNLLANNRQLSLRISGVFVNVSDEIQSALTELPNVEYTGPYNNPDDLEDIYRQIDIVWACYPYSPKVEGNYLWAKTNRFYEAGFFKKPMIASLGTVDAEFVETNQIGLVVDLSSVEAACRQLDTIDGDRLRFWDEGYQRIPESKFVYGDDFARLFELLQRKDQ